jgi:hypothetical protein
MPQVQQPILLRRQMAEDRVWLRRILRLETLSAALQTGECLINGNHLLRQQDGPAFRQPEAGPHRFDEDAVPKRSHGEPDEQRRLKSVAFERTIDPGREVVENLSGRPLAESRVRPVDDGAGVAKDVVQGLKPEPASLLFRRRGSHQAHSVGTHPNTSDGTPLDCSLGHLHLYRTDPAAASGR